MPVPAAPAARPGPNSVRVRYTRTYRDVLGRPMTGSVTITGQSRTAEGGVVTPTAPVTVALVDGVLAVDLPPDTYTVAASLRTVDHATATDTDTVTLG